MTLLDIFIATYAAIQLDRIVENVFLKKTYTEHVCEVKIPKEEVNKILSSFLEAQENKDVK